MVGYSPDVSDSSASESTAMRERISSGCGVKIYVTKKDGDA
jgi:hypothetical protein